MKFSQKMEYSVHLYQTILLNDTLSHKINRPHVSSETPKIGPMFEHFDFVLANDNNNIFCSHDGGVTTQLIFYGAHQIIL